MALDVPECTQVDPTGSGALNRLISIPTSRAARCHGRSGLPFNRPRWPSVEPPHPGPGHALLGGTACCGPALHSVRLANERRVLSWTATRRPSLERVWTISRRTNTVVHRVGPTGRPSVPSPEGVRGRRPGLGGSTWVAPMTFRSCFGNLNPVGTRCRASSGFSERPRRSAALPGSRVAPCSLLPRTWTMNHRDGDSLSPSCPGTSRPRPQSESHGKHSSVPVQSQADCGCS
jgi:hypothetical protein